MERMKEGAQVSPSERIRDLEAHMPATGILTDMSALPRAESLCSILWRSFRENAPTTRQAASGTKSAAEETTT